MGNRIDLPTVEMEFAPGAVIPFGRTLWCVLDVDLAAGKALVISEHSVAERPYHNEWAAITWEKSDIRAWLNGEYLNSAFSKEEHEAILETEVRNPDNPQYGTTTKDKVFLLSLEEAQKYFKSDKERATGGRWWLRSPGYYERRAAYVLNDGSLDVRGSYVDNGNGIRPAFYINLESDIFKSIIIDQSSESITIRVPQMVVKDNVILDYTWKTEAAVIPEGVITIGDSAFLGRGSLTSITIPDSVTSIGDSAFLGCGSLTSIAIPDSVTSIGKEAFARCSSLISITIPDSVTRIGERAFYECSSLTSITIPDSMTSIGNYAFCNCSSLISITIPDSVTSIGNYAFYNCSSLTSITIPDSVTSIGNYAFAYCIYQTIITTPDFVTSIGNVAFNNCSNLTSITIPDSVTSIGNGAFYNCICLTSITIPDSVTSIGNDAFYNCSSLTSITIPDSVTSIGKKAFARCSSLTSITILGSVTSIGDLTFDECDSLECVQSPFPAAFNMTGKNSFVFIKSADEKKTFYAYSSKTNSDNLTDFGKRGKWDRYDLDLVNNGPKYKYKLPVRLVGALGRLMDPIELSDENRLQFRELVVKNIKKIIPLAESMNQPELVASLFELGLVDEHNQKAVRKLIAASTVPEIAVLSDMPIRNVTTDEPVIAEKTNTEVSPLEQEYEEKLKAIHGDMIIKCMKWVGTSMPICVLCDQTKAPDALFRFIMASYGSQDRSSGYHIDEEADKAAALLSYDSLLDAIDAVSGHLDGPYYPSVIPLICRFGSAKQIRKLIESWKDWGDWQKYHQKGRIAQEKLQDCLILSDTREAVLWLEKKELLSNYAAIRGISVADVYEKYLFDIGFDEQGKRMFDLGTTTIEAALTKDLKIALYDINSGKAVRAIPKKNVDPSVQKAAANELTDLRQNLKKIARIKNDQLFADYIDKKETSAASWKQSYLVNPLLRRIAELLVWAQGGRTFILTDNGAIDCEGKDYSITEEEIFVAHPMEMKAEEVHAWQKYFTSHGLKQPFPQVWEPVYQEKSILPDRYKGIAISPKYLKNQEKRGIEANWFYDEYYDACYLRIKGFDTEAEDATDDDRDDWYDQRLQIVHIEPLAWNRRANNVIAFLDRITIYGRIKKDDVSIINLMDGFTLEQISDFINVALENKATNLLALLMDNKNKRFADFDPMDAFLLD